MPEPDYRKLSEEATDDLRDIMGDRVEKYGHEPVVTRKPDEVIGPHDLPDEADSGKRFTCGACGAVLWRITMLQRGSVEVDEGWMIRGYPATIAETYNEPCGCLVRPDRAKGEKAYIAREVRRDATP